MKTMIQKGDILDLVAPAGGVVGGSPLLVGSLLVIPVATAAEGETYAGQVVGVFSVAKAAEDLVVGDKAYWDDTAKKFTKTATSNTLVGVFVSDALSAVGTINVRLNGAVV